MCCRWRCFVYFLLQLDILWNFYNTYNLSNACNKLRLSTLQQKNIMMMMMMMMMSFSSHFKHFHHIVSCVLLPGIKAHSHCAHQRTLTRVNAWRRPLTRVDVRCHSNQTHVKHRCIYIAHVAARFRTSCHARIKTGLIWASFWRSYNAPWRVAAVVKLSGWIRWK